MKFEVIEKGKKKRWIIGSIAVIGLISIGIYAGICRQALFLQGRCLDFWCSRKLKIRENEKYTL